MIISLVAAVSENNVIGKDNQLLWNLPNDTKFFKNTTWAMPVIMGRKTFESLNNKPLTGRFNIIITRNPLNIKTDGHVRIAASLDEAIAIAKETDAKEAFIVGGGQIYAESLPIADKIVLTRVHAIVQGDAYFPEFGENDWKLFSRLDFPTDEKHQYAYSFEVWDRIKK
jgi:dihydrofolate reductase